MIFIIGNQSREMAEIYNVKHTTFEKDREIAEGVLECVQRECGAISAFNKPIVFMGFPDNITAEYGEVEESSIFVWDRNVDEFNTRRIFSFFEELGYSLNSKIGNIDYDKIRENLYFMKSYPEDGCVAENEEYIIVKLGDSLCETLKNYSIVESNGQLEGNIEGFAYENNIISMKGWLIKIEQNAYDNNISLILYNDNISYRLRIDEVQRPDITQYYGYNYNFDNSGINAYISIPKCVVDGEYKVYLELKDKNEVLQYDINQMIRIKQ